MPTRSLKERIEWLERELPPNPPRFKVHDDLPFGILVYEPDEEWLLRREVRHLATRIEKSGTKVVFISLAELMWEAIEKSEGVEAVIQLEQDRGFEKAQAQVNTYLSDPAFAPLPDALAARLAAYDPACHLCFVVRGAAMAPGIYPVSKLMENMQGKTKVPTILFYPGLLRSANGLVYMGFPNREPLGSYRVKIYG